MNSKSHTTVIYIIGFFILFVVILYLKSGKQNTIIKAPIKKVQINTNPENFPYTFISIDLDTVLIVNNDTIKTIYAQMGRNQLNWEILKKANTETYYLTDIIIRRNDNKYWLKGEMFLEKKFQ